MNRIPDAHLQREEYVSMIESLTANYRLLLDQLQQDPFYDPEPVINFFNTKVYTFGLLLNENVNELNTVIFKNDFVRDFVLELTERFALDCDTITQDGYQLLMKTIAKSKPDYKDFYENYKSTQERQPSIIPVLKTLTTEKSELIKTLNKNPWLVTVLFSRFIRLV